MGRFYQATEGKFVDDNIYQMPYELAQTVIGNAEQRVDNQIAQTELLSGALDEIKHLDYDAENQRVAGIQDKYGTMIDDLTAEIQKNPLEFQRNMPALKKAQREILKDKQSGEIFQVEQRYNEFQKWLKDNEGVKERDPNLYNRVRNKVYSDVTTRATQNPAARFKGDNIVERPDLSSKESREIFDNIKANVREKLTKDGTYNITDKGVSEQRVARIAMSELLSNPSYSGYLKQMSELGDEGYLDENGNPLPVFGAEGKLNADHPFARDIASIAETYGFSDITMEENKYGLQRSKGNIDNILEQRKQIGKERIQGMKGDQGRLLASDKHKYAMELQALKDAAKKDQIGYKLKLEKKLAKDEGDTETLDAIAITVRPFKVASREEQVEIGKAYVNLHAKVTSGAKLSDSEQIQYNKSQAMYQNVALEHGDDILKAAGENPDDYTTPELKQARVAKIISEISQLNDPEFGTKKINLPYDPKALYTPRTSYDYSERNRIKDIKNKVSEKIGDFDEILADKMVVTRSFMPVNTQSEIGKRGMGLVNTLFQTGVQPIIQGVNSLSHDVEDKKRGGKRIDVDTSSFGVGQTSDPLRDIMAKTETGTPQELAEKGFGTFRWREERGDYIVDFIPNNAALKAVGIDVKDRNWDQNGFSMRYSNVETNPWKDLEMTPAMQEMRMEGDMTYGEASQKVDINVASLKASGESRPFQMGGNPDTMYKIEFDEKSGNYILMQGYSKDTEQRWQEYKDQGLYAKTKDPEKIKLLLRQNVIAEQKNK